VLFGDYEKMSLCGWVDIRKNHTKVVFVFDCRRNLFVCYFAKDAVGHGTRVSLITCSIYKLRDLRGRIADSFAG